MEGNLILLKYLAAIAIMIVANTIFRLAVTQKFDDFDRDALVQGIKKNLFIMLGIILVFIVGCLIPEVKFTIVEGQEMTIVDALKVTSIAIIGYYVIKCFAVMKELLMPETIDVDLDGLEENKEEKE